MRLLIADDHALFRGSLRCLLEARGLDVVGEASNGAEAVAMSAELSPDVVLMDLSMPEMDGLAATRRLAEEQPGVRVIVLTASNEDEDLYDALRAGAQGYLLKDLEADSFFELLTGAVDGEPALTPQLARKVVNAFARTSRNRSHRTPADLTEREVEILRLMVQGVTSNRQLARRLQVSENTVKFHVRNILDKLHLHNRAQAVSMAVRQNLLGDSPG